MKSRDGFTLIELLAVVVILALTFMFIAPKMVSLINEGNNTNKKIFEEKMIDAAKEYVFSNNEEFLNTFVTEGDQKIIYESDLINSKLIDSKDIENIDDFLGVKVKLLPDDKFEYTVVYTNDTTDVACFSYEEIHQLSSFDINEEACKTYFAGAPVDQVETFCTGGEVEGYSLKDEINEGWRSLEELETEGVISNVQYADVISITGYSETCPKDVTIPGKIDNKTVVAIGDYAFTTEGVDPSAISNDLLYENYAVSTLDAKSYNENILPISYVSIGIGITSVTIPNSVTFIGSSAFSYNQITEVNFPTTPLTLGCDVFTSNPIYDTLAYPSNITAETCPT